MDVVVRARNLDLSDELLDLVRRSVAFAVDRHSGRVERIVVYLADLNGPRGGEDKLCQITANLKGSRPALILERGENLAAVVSRATRRLGYRIGRSLQRARASGARSFRTTIRAA